MLETLGTSLCSSKLVLICSEPQILNAFALLSQFPKALLPLGCAAGLDQNYMERNCLCSEGKPEMSMVCVIMVEVEEPHFTIYIYIHSIIYIKTSLHHSS